MRYISAKTYVYFAQVRDGGPVKIGCSRGPLDRIKDLQAWCPLPLDFICMVEGDAHDEFAIHEHLRDFRMHSEWFEPSKALTALVSDIRDMSRLPEMIVVSANARRRRIQKEKDRSGSSGKRGPRDEYRESTPEVAARRAARYAATAARKRASYGLARTMEFRTVAVTRNRE